MDTFVPQVAAAPAPDPSKHVNYTLGMVLGVDDFTQEFAYLSGRDQRLARDLLGYGTVSGLRLRAPYQIEEVAVRDFIKWLHHSIEITNTPGQFLSLDDFLDEIRNAVLIPGSPPDSPPASPPHMPPDFMKDVPAIFLRVHPSDACRYLSAALRQWVTEMRALWRPPA